MINQNPMEKLNIEERITFYRHWLWADHFKNEYGKSLKSRQKTEAIEGLYGLQGAQCLWGLLGRISSLN